jgi:hypothetical protein
VILWKKVHHINLSLDRGIEDACGCDKQYKYFVLKNIFVFP